MKTIAIIWAGAAGLMTAATILENHLTSSHSPSERGDKKEEFHIHLFEKNKSPGNKIILSWGGRCNVTTSITDKKILATKYTRGWDFIKKSFGKFGPKKCYEWFESHGVPLKTQADMRVFPVSDDGNDIVDVFERVFAKYRDKISIHYGEWVSDVSILSSWGTKDLPLNNINTDSSAVGMTKEKNTKKYSITTSRWVYEANILVITTGGNAYSHTGSSGDGYTFASTLGHTITKLWPSLSSFLTSETWIHSLSGLAFENAKIGELQWPLLFTHFWLSGPLAFMYSSQIAWEKLDKDTQRQIYFSPLSDINEKMWDDFLKQEFWLHPKKTITTILGEKLPRRFLEWFVTEFFPHISETYVSGVSKSDRLRIAELLGRWIPITLIWRRPWDEFVTAGGINTDEIDGETMESKIQKNLYFAGEVLNVDGYTGGFSLQICWASGYTAGRDIANKINK